MLLEKTEKVVADVGERRERGGDVAKGGGGRQSDGGEGGQWGGGENVEEGWRWEKK